MLFKKRKPAPPADANTKQQEDNNKQAVQQQVANQVNDATPPANHADLDEHDIPILDDVVVDGEPLEAPKPEEAESEALSPQAELEDLIDELVERTMGLMREQLKDGLMAAVKKRYP